MSKNEIVVVVYVFCCGVVFVGLKNCIVTDTADSLSIEEAFKIKPGRQAGRLTEKHKHVSNSVCLYRCIWVPLNGGRGTSQKPYKFYLFILANIISLYGKGAS